jgi:uncharacterized membrane protein (DUF4010 family)
MAGFSFSQLRAALSPQDRLDALTLAGVAIALPFIPDITVDPWGLVNPHSLWRLALVLMALSTLGYVAQRTLGPRWGLTVAGFIAGFVSSTVAIATMGDRAKDDDGLVDPAAAGAVAAVLGSLSYLVALVAFANASLFLAMLPAFIGTVVPTLAYTVRLGWRAAALAVPLKVAGRAFDARLILAFTGLVAVFSLVGRAMNAAFGDAGLIASSAVSGFMDIHATAAALATLLGAGKTVLPVATLALLVALTVNMGMKLPVGFVLGSRRYALRVAAGLLSLIGGLWAGHAVGQLLG